MRSIALFLCISLLAAFPTLSLSAQKEIKKQEKQRILESLGEIISIELKNVPLEEALTIIAKKGKFKLNYNRSRIPVQKNVSVKMDKVPVWEVLQKVMIDTKLELVVTKAGLLAVVPAKTSDYKPPRLKTGSIKGKVLYAETKEPLGGVNVTIVNSDVGTITDKNGNFLFQGILVGSYSFVFSLPGFEKHSKTDIIVRSKRITFVQVELRLAPVETDEVIVTARYFSQTDTQPTSNASFSSEEVRRSPSLLGDVTRVIKVLPSVGKINHQWNGLIVRGGSPVENGYFVDNIEIPNLNHYPVQGSSDGLVSLLNVDFIENVNFFAGGFSAAYGDKLSSITALTLRSGNREELDFQLDLNLAGIGGTAEGPLGKEKGSWLLSARRSFTGFLADFMEAGESDVPEYSDLLGKLVYDLAPNHRISFLNILGVDYWSWSRDDAVEDGDNFYGDVNITQNTVGINWRYLWGDRGYSDTSISHILVKNKWGLLLTTNTETFFEKNSQEHEFRIRNINHFRLNPVHKLEFGIEAKLLKSNYDDIFGEYNDLAGNETPELPVNKSFTTQKYGAFVNYIWKPWKRLTITPGIHIGHFAYNKRTNISPRLSFSYKMSDKTSINSATGIYHQNIPMVLLSQRKEFKDLRNPRAIHVVLGVQHLLTEDTRMTLELFHKEYEHFPLDPIQSTFFIMDEAVYRYFFYNHEHLVDSGRARSYGVEFMIHKKLTRKFYGLLGGSLFRSRYRDFDGVWRNRIFDNRYNATIEAGYKPNPDWEFSLRWIVGGGVPYTPHDIAASKALGRGVLDIKNTNSQRLPWYNYLSIRLDKRFHFSGSTLIFFFSLWNVFNNQGLDMYEWNEVYNSLSKGKGFPRTPVFGLEFEF